MSANCTKDLEITIGQPLTLLSYWKFDEATGTRNDSHGTNHLTETGVAVPSQAGIISNATLCNTFAGVQTLDNLAPSPNLWTYTSGLTVAGWLFINGNMTLSAGSFLTCPSSNSSFGIASSIFPANQLRFFADSPMFTLQVVTPVPVLGAFFFIRMWVDPADNKLHAKINEGTTLDSIGTFTPFSPDAQTLLRFGRPNDAFVNYDTGHDEFGIWRGIMTNAQGAFLYNGGTARTYPDVPGI